MSFTQPQGERLTNMQPNKHMDGQYSSMDEMPRLEGTRDVALASAVTNLKHMLDSNVTTSTPTSTSSSNFHSIHQQPLPNQQHSALATFAGQANTTSAYSDPSLYQRQTQELVAHQSTVRIPTGPKADSINSGSAVTSYRAQPAFRPQTSVAPPTAPRAFAAHNMSSYQYNPFSMPPPPPPVPGHYGTNHQPVPGYYYSTNHEPLPPHYHGNYGIDMIMPKVEQVKTERQGSSTLLAPSSGLRSAPFSPAYSTDGSSMSISDCSYSPFVPTPPGNIQVEGTNAGVPLSSGPHMTFSQTHGTAPKLSDYAALTTTTQSPSIAGFTVTTAPVSLYSQTYGQPMEQAQRPQPQPKHFGGDDRNDVNSAAAKADEKQLDKLLNDQKVARAEWVLIQAKHGSNSDEARAAYQHFCDVKKERAALRVESVGAVKIMKQESKKKYKKP